MRSSEPQEVSVLPESSQQSPHNKDAVLPPLTSQFPQWSRTRKLEIGVFTKPFSRPNEDESSLQRVGKVTKKVPELAALGRSEGLVVSPATDPLLRAAQLEQNIRFLQEQHQVMLASLHQEVELLRQRNRDLQFQLVFTKGGVTLVQSSPSPSSSEDDGKPKIFLSPKQLNMTPLQVEILERDIAELKGALQEAKTKNLYLSGIVEEQKKKIDSMEVNKRELETVGTKIIPKNRSDAQIQAEGFIEESEDQQELIMKLDDAEKVIRRLQRENDDHRRELVSIRSNLSKNIASNGGVGRQLGATSRGGVGHHRTQHQQQTQSQRFPPLHSQSYWHHGQQSQHRAGMEFVSHRHCANGGNTSRLEKETQPDGRLAPTLPNLRNNITPSSYSYTNSNNGNGHRRGGTGVRYASNGNHYYRGSKEEETERRKYRGGGVGAKGSRESKQ
uniref:(California timema) hypothetical protein n=1 Tax=Timema californicum TaxID=61474 RepID=A0A7R9PC77_TIMCA|nr:unnamed protein product [Timema californicum]